MNRLDLSDTALRTLPRILRQQAEQIPDLPYLIQEETRTSFGEADAVSDALAAGLAQLGVAEGDRVSLYLSSRIEFVLLAFAAMKLGAAWVPISTDYRGEWLADTIERGKSRVLITEAELAPRVEEVASRLGEARVVVLDTAAAGAKGLASRYTSYEALLAAPPIELDLAGQHYGDTCAVLWTSGTTGKSKGVLQSHNNWIRAIAQGAMLQFESRPGDVIYNVLPLFNSAAWVTSVFRGLLEGLPVVLDAPFSVTHFWDRIRHYGATQTFTLGAMHMFLWNAPERPDDADNPLRLAQMVPMPPDIEGPFEKRFGMQILGAGYGQSEALFICSSAERQAPPGSLGYPPADIEVKLFDDDDNEVAPGEVGEVRIKEIAPHCVCNGYFDNEEAMRDAYRGADREWYCTGDLARMGAKGAFFFVDRKRDAIRFAGRNISTMEVEGIARRHPAIADVAAFGISSQEVATESELALAVVLAEGQNPSHADIARFINDNAPHYFVPRYMEFVRELPYTPTNKVQKFKLREQGISTATWDRKASDFELER